MDEFLEFRLDKFTFKVATDRSYLPDGVWAKVDGKLVTVGVSDFFQQHNGDVAFAEVLPIGTELAVGEEFATLETIKINLELPSPVAGTIAAVNEVLELEAEVINMDPYGAGWLAIIRAEDWARDKASLMLAEAYFEHMKTQAQAEM
jgi:glycine cleavage system H protein